MKDRILKNPLTSLAGLICLGFAAYVLNIDIDAATKLTLSTILIGAGLIGLGLKDNHDA